MTWLTFPQAKKKKKKQKLVLKNKKQLLRDPLFIT